MCNPENITHILFIKDYLYFLETFNIFLTFLNMNVSKSVRKNAYKSSHKHIYNMCSPKVSVSSRKYVLTRVLHNSKMLSSESRIFSYLQYFPELSKCESF